MNVKTKNEGQNFRRSESVPNGVHRHFTRQRAISSVFWGIIFGLTSGISIPAEPTLPTSPLPLPTPEEQKRLESDPFFQSFSAAFDEVLDEKTPELNAGREEDSNPSSEKKNVTSNSFDSASETTLFSFCEKERQLLLTDLAHGAIQGNSPGHKARRSFLFVPNEAGEWKRIEVGGDFDMMPGEMIRTGRALDAAICGEGFFRLVKRPAPIPDEKTDETVPGAVDFENSAPHVPFFSRAGNFQTDSDGFLFLTLPPAAGKGGGDEKTDYYLDPPAKSLQEVTSLVRFTDSARLASSDGVLFSPTEASGPPETIETAEEENSASPINSASSAEGTMAAEGAETIRLERTAAHDKKGRPSLLIGYLELSNARPDLILDELDRLERIMTAIRGEGADQK